MITSKLPAHDADSYVSFYDPREDSVLYVRVADADAASDNDTGSGRETTDSSGWVTNRQLVVKGIPESSQQRARESGKLPYVNLGNDTYSYRQSDVDRWLSRTRGDRQERQKPARRGATSASRTPQRSAKETLDCLAKHVAAQEGVSEAAAKTRVLRQHPELRQQLVSEANR